MRLSEDYRELLSFGVAWLDPFEFNQDFLGLGIDHLKPLRK